MSRLFSAYKSLLIRYPVTSQTIQTSLLVGSGDVIAQVFIEKRTLKTYDAKRTLQFFCVGAFYLGPVLTIWYRCLDRLIGSGGRYSGLKKMACDQILFAPFGIGGFILSANVLQGQSRENIKNTFKSVYWDVLINNYKLWPAVQIINFSFVPLHFQVLVVQIVALFWNTYMCYVTKPKEE